MANSRGDDPEGDRDAVPAYLLAGGASSRFGSDKARYRVHGEMLLQRLAYVFQARSMEVTVVARKKNAYADLGLRTIADSIPERGPLGGLVTALADLESPGWLLLASCDLARIDLNWVDQLLAARDNQRDAIAFHDGRWQPLFALYHSRVAVTVIDHLDRGILAMHRLLDQVRTARLHLPEGTLEQWNTPPTCSGS